MSGKPVDLGIVVVLLAGIVLFRSIRTARSGNLTSALALLCAVVVIIRRYPVSPVSLLLCFAVAGTVTGGFLARRVSMVRIPAMVALQNGMGGMASFLVSYVEMARSASTPGSRPGDIAALLSIVVGATAFSGSLVAAGRLSQYLSQKPRVIRDHNRIMAILAAMALLLVLGAAQTSSAAMARALALALIGISAALGLALSMRVGGADMPVMISFLNAGSGLAAALCGLSIGNWLLVAGGAMVGVSGMILTGIMCQAMNRRLAAVLVGVSAPGAAPPTSPWETEPSPTEQGAAGETPPSDAISDPFDRALTVVLEARRIIVVPGYGMALAEAQDEVSHLADTLKGMGKEVTFAIHPVAGRMPGHMHVLLAEAEVDYGLIRDLPDVNPEFAQADAALIVGACDVVNPAAVEQISTPISGMPILLAHEAKNVIVCNLDDQPGYSGVDNPLYRDPRTIMLTGDAKATLARLLGAINSGHDA